MTVGAGTHDVPMLTVIWRGARMTNGETASGLSQTPLYALHRELGARLVPFAGYEMPVQYPSGIIAEHNHVRASAGLFDVSHMGQACLTGANVAQAIETVVPGDIAGLAPGAMRYSLLLNESGGIFDDLMITRPAEDDTGSSLFLVVNAARKAVDFESLGKRLDSRIALDRFDSHALLALQGPKAAAVMARFAASATKLRFMEAGVFTVDRVDWMVSRSGYTGEDGFEISVPGDVAPDVARRLLAEPEVEPIGLGARDSLRLEAGLCLYGHDIDEKTTPVEASLTWTIAKRRRAARDFPGADHILSQIEEGPARRRVGFKLEGRLPAREDAAIETPAGAPVGRVTSGGFGPTVNAAIGMGYVDAAQRATDTPLRFVVRGKKLPGRVVKMPFVPANYYRGG